MPLLGTLASLIRSKNAGPFQLTFDIMFRDEATYRRVKASGALSAAVFARLYDTPIERVLFVEHDRALAFKATIPRPLFQGEIGETDMFGGQQFDPVAHIDVPLDGAA